MRKIRTGINFRNLPNIVPKAYFTNLAFHFGYKMKKRKRKENIIYNLYFNLQTLAEKGYELVSGGTENHLVLVNLKTKVIEMNLVVLFSLEY